MNWPSVWLTTLLLAGFFAPPLAVGPKKVFLIDLMFYAWPVFYLVRRSNGLAPRKAGPALLAGAGLIALMAVVYLHGYARIDLRSQLAEVLARGEGGQAFSPFSWMQDGIIFSRFASWGLAAALLWAEAAAAPGPWRRGAQDLARVWGIVAAIEGAVALVGFIHPLRPLLGQLYGYDPEYLSWRHRAHGTFSSPVELGAALLPGVLYWILEARKSPRKALAPLALSGGALLLSGSYSALMGLLAAVVFFYRGTLKKHPVMVLSLAGVLLLFIAFMVFLSQPLADRYPWFAATGIQTKIPNFLFRLRPWRIFLETLFSRWDYLALGLGFARSHSDNGYLQILRTGGVALLGAYLLFAARGVRGLRAAASPWGPWALLSVISLLVAAFSIDALIFRVTGPFLLIILSLSVAFRTPSR